MAKLRLLGLYPHLSGAELVEPIITVSADAAFHDMISGGVHRVREVEGYQAGRNGDCRMYSSRHERNSSISIDPCRPVLFEIPFKGCSL
ncbi:hypothetical protein [Trinickia acidisoli]|uniref:hypothetical protein n=1 Tax=Trinickia acidisoli TaxID=2767482 RepID=UPI001A8C4C83|nr:hypothetical protein [Trinickia acidisoli]